MTELTNQCDDCGWILGHYIYTYDDRKYIVAEHMEEAREADPYGRQPHTPYKPGRTGRTAAMDGTGTCPATCWYWTRPIPV